MSKKSTAADDFLTKVLGNNHYKTLLDSLFDAVYFVDRDRRILYWNKAAEEITGYKGREILGNYCWNNILEHVDTQGCNLCTEVCPLKHTIDDGKTRQDMVFLHHRDGHRVPVNIRVVAVRDNKGDVIGAVETFNDLSSNNVAIQRIEELEKLVYIDHLTGLANRRYTEISLNSRLQEIQRYGWSFGLVFMDIDHFKNINDQFGHDVGDQTLKMVAKTLLSVSRSFDTLGRWGGEEFMAIVPKITKPTLHTISNRYRVLVNESAFESKSQKINVTISVGATLALPNDTQDTLLQRVDTLMYQSKKKQGDCISIDE